MRIAGPPAALIALLVIVSAGLTATAAAEGWHTVESGQSLYTIARHYGCTVVALQEANDIHGTLIRPEQRLHIPDCTGDEHPLPMPTVHGQSVGTPWDGQLRDGVRLPDGRGYHVRRPQRAWGASYVVRQVERAIAAARRRFPDTHTLAIGDLSARRGGTITEHRSHQSGRDADIGLFYVEKPRGYPDEFVIATARNLDRAATWALLQAFVRTTGDDGGVAMIFLDYDVQGLLYEWALDHGVPEEYLDRLFQYPDGPDTPTGLVRHVDYHADHMHVRFKCLAGDELCR